jgi:cytochrome c peroxidase
MKTRWLGIALLLFAALLMTACGGGGGGTPAAGGQTAGTVAVQGNLAGQAAAVALVRQVELAGDTAVLMVDETGNVAASQVVSPQNGQFSLEVPEGHDYVMVFREGSTAGRTLGILTPDGSGRTTLSFPAGAADLNLGDIELDAKKGRASCLSQTAVAFAAIDLTDSDSDGIPDICDNSTDHDGDLVADAVDDFPFDAAESEDTDNDGTGNHADGDDDNDGVADAQDAFPKNPNEVADADGDGIGDNADLDDDNDGADDDEDAFPHDPTEFADADGDGIGDIADADDDNDGVADAEDAFPRDPAASKDTDTDGHPDEWNPNATAEQIAASDLVPDAFPLNIAEWADTDGDGVGDNEEAAVRNAARFFALDSLAVVPVPEPENLADFLNPGDAARTAAIQLGKALFWDMQVGSDGVQACGSCHFHAGADNRTKNQLSPHGVLPPGQPVIWNTDGPNYELVRADFPFHRLQNPEEANFNLRMEAFDSDDVVSSQGVFKADFGGLDPGGAFDIDIPVADTIFNVNGVNTRRVEPRNTPTMINAVFNFSNFWDGRAHPVFNGESVIGPLDDTAGVWVEVGGALTKVPVAIPNASLASQAMGPPLSVEEMSYVGRTFPDIGRKLLSLRPLALQNVHPEDSVLGALADAGSGTGLTVSYAALIQAAFQPAYWGSAQLTPAGFSQMEDNFALFFGLAVQMYEATLVSDQAPFDRFMEGDDAALSPDELRGLRVFMNIGAPPQRPGGQFADLFAGVARGSCIACHEGPEFTAHSVAVASLEPIEMDFVVELVDGLIVESEPLALAFLDEGMYNIGVRPTDEDLGRGGTINGIPLSFTRQAIEGFEFPFAELPTESPIEFPGLFPIDNRNSVDGAFKVPGLRNVELTGPYFHNGGQASLAEVLEFYDRKGDFSDVNIVDLDGAMALVELNEEDEEALIAFLLALTDERVRYVRAPFDHPQISVPHGHPGNNLVITHYVTIDGVKQADNSWLDIPAVGAGGGVEPLKPFLNIDHMAD